MRVTSSTPIPSSTNASDNPGFRRGVEPAARSATTRTLKHGPPDSGTTLRYATYASRPALHTSSMPNCTPRAQATQYAKFYSQGSRHHSIIEKPTSAATTKHQSSPKAAPLRRVGR
ncbi:hypothetical protein PMIN04_013227 [Paraphaeosphaeria minitans]